MKQLYRTLKDKKLKLTNQEAEAQMVWWISGQSAFSRVMDLKPQCPGPFTGACKGIATTSSKDATSSLRAL